MLIGALLLGYWLGYVTGRSDERFNVAMLKTSPVRTVSEVRTAQVLARADHHHRLVEDTLTNVFTTDMVSAYPREIMVKPEAPALEGSWQFVANRRYGQNGR